MSIVLNARTALSLDHISERDFLLQAAIITDVMWFVRNQTVHCGIQHYPYDLVSNMKRRFMEHWAAWTELDQVENLVWRPFGRDV